LKGEKLAVRRSVDIVQEGTGTPQGTASTVQGTANTVQGTASAVQGTASTVQGTASTVPGTTSKKRRRIETHRKRARAEAKTNIGKCCMVYDNLLTVYSILIPPCQHSSEIPQRYLLFK
jgi:hypothetical protein